MEESNKSQHVLTTTKQHLQFHRIVGGGGWSHTGFICNQIQFAFTDWLLLSMIYPGWQFALFIVILESLLWPQIIRV